MNKKLIFTASVVALFFYAANLWALSPEIRFDMLKTKLAQQLKGQKYGDALETMNEIKSLGVATPSSLDYFEGKALFETGKKYEAYEKLEDYVSKHGKKARLEAEQRARRKQEQEALWRKEAEEFSSHPVIDKEFGTGQMWTLPVAEQYRDNPYLLIKVYGSAQEATDFCQNLNVEGYSDWRLPTRKDILEKLPCHIAYELKFLKDDPLYNKIWYGSSSFVNKRKGYQDPSICKIKSASKTDHFKVRCVRDVGEKKTDKGKKMTPQKDMEGR